MKTRPTLLVALLATLLLSVAALATAHPARAQVGAAPSTAYSLTWYTVAGGGGTSAGGGYTLSGTAGQSDAGTLTGSNPSSYTLAGGFWAGLAAALHNLFLPLVQR